jgi:TolA-binding protein
MKLERFDSQKVYDADFEIARAFQKHFLTQNASKKPIEVGEPFVAPQKNTNMARPSTAPGPRPAGLGVHQPKRLPGRLQLLKDDDEDEGNGLAGRKRLRDIEEDNEKVEELKEEINDLKADNEELREEVDQLNDRIKDLETDIRTLELQTKALKAENQTLNAVMQLNKLPTTTADNLTPESAE